MPVPRTFDHVCRSHILDCISRFLADIPRHLSVGAPILANDQQDTLQHLLQKVILRHGRLSTFTADARAVSATRAAYHRSTAATDALIRLDPRLNRFFVRLFVSLLP